VRNRKRTSLFSTEGWKPSRKSQAFLGVAEEYLADATQALPDAHRCAELSRQSLYYALHAGEKIELERARATVPRNDRRPHFFLGCDIHACFQMDVALFLSRFTTVLTPLAGTADPRI